MKVSTKGRYAIRLMVDLARQDKNVFTSLRDISQRQNVSMKYMEQIVGQLSRAGLLESVRGPQGGYKLIKPVQQYTVGEILRATEGSLAPVVCLEGDENTCERAPTCPTLPFWEGLYGVITQYVDNVSLQELVTRSMGHSGEIC